MDGHAAIVRMCFLSAIVSVMGHPAGGMGHQRRALARHSRAWHSSLWLGEHPDMFLSLLLSRVRVRFVVLHGCFVGPSRIIVNGGQTAHANNRVKKLMSAHSIQCVHVL